MSTSTLYTALRRLLEQEWIRKEGDANQGEGGRDRKVYRLTELGRLVLDAEVDRLERLVYAARQRAVGESGAG